MLLYLATQCYYIQLHKCYYIQLHNVTIFSYNVTIFSYTNVTIFSYTMLLYLATQCYYIQLHKCYYIQLHKCYYIQLHKCYYIQLHKANKNFILSTKLIIHETLLKIDSTLITSSYNSKYRTDSLQHLQEYFVLASNKLHESHQI